MEAQRSPGGSPAASLPSNELWGREVYDAAGLRLGTIDSVVRTFGGGAKAIVKNRRLPSTFVDLDTATFDGEAIAVPWTRAEGSTSEFGAPQRRRLIWPLTLRRHG